MSIVLDKFIQHGMKASYHYADDTGSEWPLGDAEKSHALDLFDSSPCEHEEMRKAATRFFWVFDEIRAAE